MQFFDIDVLEMTPVYPPLFSTIPQLQSNIRQLLF